MQLLQQIYTDCPENIAIPLEYQHRKVRIIILPLEEDFIHPAWQKDYIENGLLLVRAPVLKQNSRWK